MAPTMMTIEVLGPGLPTLHGAGRASSARSSWIETGVSADVRYVTDPAEIVSRGFFMRTPGLVVDGRVVATGGSEPA